jgi:site-specific DNA-methyltransferase (adenine-specific)
MVLPKSLFEVLNIGIKDITHISKELDIPRSRLIYYNDNRKMPVGGDLETICKYYNISSRFLSLSLGVLDYSIYSAISQKGKEVEQLLNVEFLPVGKKKTKIECFSTKMGSVFRQDCIEYMLEMESDSVDMIFADPPFNLNKLYPSKMNDSIKIEEYALWQEAWISECARILKHGGSLFIWNLPKWNTLAAKYLDDRLTLKHWIAVDIRYSLPISGRLYPSHYALLYYIKGNKANTFTPDRIPMAICPKCFGDLVDYGGYKDKMNPDGVNLADIWQDIPPVRHTKYKRRSGANELSIKLLDRVIEMSTTEGDLVFDPFGGAGTTYIVAEMKNRKWLGTEIGPLADIENRFSVINEERENLAKIRNGLNALFTKESMVMRVKNKLWTPESVRKKKNNETELNFD